MNRALATAALGIDLCLAGAIFDSPSLYVPGVGLVVIALGAIAWVRLAARDAQVRRAAGPHTVVEDEPWPLRLELSAGVLPPPGGELLEPLLGWPVPVAGRWSRRIRINVRFSRRGRRRLEPAVLLVRDPLGLDHVEVRGEGGEELLVLPRIEPVEPVRGGGAGSGSTGEGEQFGPSRRLDRSTAELEIDGLRPYRQGAPASRIHWPAVARTGDMLERRLVAGLDSSPLVVLDAWRPQSEEALDAAVRAAASLAWSLARGGGCAILLPGDRRPTPIDDGLAVWPAVHARLALVTPSAPLALPARLGRHRTLLYVAPVARRLPAPVLAGGRRVLVVPGEQTGAPVLEVAGCRGYLLGPRAEARAA